MFKKLKDIFTDSILYGLSSVVGQLISLILVPYFTKELSPTDYGLLNMVGLILIFITPVAGLALDTALFRFYSLEENQNYKIQYFTSASLVKTISVFFIVLILVPFYNLLNTSFFEGLLTRPIFYIVLVSFIFENFSSLSIVVLRSQRKSKIIAVNSILTVLFGLIFSIYFVLYLHWGVLGALLASLIASVFRMLLYIRINYIFFKLELFSWEKVKLLINYSFPMIPHKIQGNIIGLFTAFMINQNFGLIYSGYYAVASKVSKPFVMIVTMVQQSWTPYKFHIHKTDHQASKSFSDIISFYWNFLIFIWILISLLVPYVFDLLIDSKFSPSKKYIPFLMFISLAQAIYFTITTGFELKNNQKKIVVASFLSAVFLVSFSLISINFFPPYTFFIIQAFSFFVLAAVLYPDARKIIKIDYPFIKTLIYLLIGILIIGVSYYFNSLIINLVSIVVLVILTIVQFKWVFPQYQLKLILTKFIKLKPGKS
ncbi:lipopolysaccharide biosynthesis protein [Flavobacterium sp.]|jgi:O-antigen/teichoic acid export membrane protein|uniref:lipopolysaccharide biosynthesis protein n=1 Tax=Flavobacterium sp. TaxID=239 RepID=UPI0037C03458